MYDENFQEITIRVLCVVVLVCIGIMQKNYSNLHYYNKPVQQWRE